MASSAERVAAERGWAELIFKVFETAPEFLAKMYILPVEILTRCKLGESAVVRSRLLESGEIVVAISLVFLPL